MLARSQKKSRTKPALTTEAVRMAVIFYKIIFLPYLLLTLMLTSADLLDLQHSILPLHTYRAVD